MKKHNLETNFQFLKNLKSSNKLGQNKLKNENGLKIENQEKFYRTIYYKKSADEFQIGKISKMIKLTIYKTNQPQPQQFLKIK